MRVRKTCISVVDFPSLEVVHTSMSEKKNINTVFLVAEKVWKQFDGRCPGTKEKAEKASSFSSELLFMLRQREKRERERERETYSSILPTSTFITINRIVTKLRRAFNSFFLSFFCGSPFICSGLYFDSRTTNLPHCTPLLTDGEKRRRDEENRADEWRSKLIHSI